MKTPHCAGIYIKGAVWANLRVAMGTPEVAVTEEDFAGYVRFRMMDVIGNAGDYRRFMNSRREQKVATAFSKATQTRPFSPYDAPLAPL